MKRIIFIFSLIVTVAVCCITLTASYGGYFNPDRSKALPAIISMTFPMWAIVTPLLGALCYFVNKKLSLATLVTMIVCFPAFWSFCPLNLFRSSHIDNDSFTFLSYNTYYEEDYLRRDTFASNPTVAAILECDADVVCLQETLKITYDHRRKVTDSQVDTLRARYPYRVYDNEFLGFLSKYPIEKVTYPELPGETAGLFVADITINGHKVRFYNTHLQSIGLTNDDKELYLELTRGNADNHLRQAKRNLLTKLTNAFRMRARQARVIANLIRDDDSENVVVCGDFNDISGCYAMRCLEAEGMTNAYSKAAVGPCYTYRANRFYFHIDQILYKGDLNPAEIHVVKDTGCSDHLPMSAVFNFN